MIRIVAISNNRSNLLISYLLLVSLLATTGFEYFFRSQVFIIPIVVIAIFEFIRQKHKIEPYIIKIVILFFLLSLIQTFLEYNRNIFSSIYLLLVLIFSYCIATVIGEKIIKYYINVLYFFALISLFCFFLTYADSFMNMINRIAPLFKSLNRQISDEENRNIIIYNFKNYSGLYNRNSGPFWEPGMFAIFLNIALIFNIFLTRKLIQVKNLVFLGALITTFSTTGYIACFYILFVYSLFFSKSFYKIIFLALLVFASVEVSQLNFMQNKVEAQIQSSQNTGDSRFGAAIVHFRVIEDFPFFGVGDGASTVIKDFTQATSTANGLTYVFVKFGIIVGILYYVFLYRSCNRIFYLLSGNRSFGIYFFILLLILSFSQDITVRPFYFFLVIWGLHIPIRKKVQN